MILFDVLFVHFQDVLRYIMFTIYKLNLPDTRSVEEVWPCNHITINLALFSVQLS